ncbi:hypothetical protein PanWU01x14_161670 [Parasponia andersonii]|uniref:Uncharacterized protein n=1 Tax=Parasponia andersonii TaxID=3476 RepID=A0A2P5CDD4_PARAD|nr:hypothetical protein PanWU01x14_161670 [Parasponia andersonii]
MRHGAVQVLFNIVIETLQRIREVSLNPSSSSLHRHCAKANLRACEAKNQTRRHSADLRHSSVASRLYNYCYHRNSNQ